ncbi:DUF6232 family protein [Streptomyces sp. NBC_00102]|uniref:DUF6232 family protein n=1 Tax=Streptomyces sp. NBC_00102 TaxID=2975652 RepID=UPI00224F9917|nr:DUF6232 family protein [Streptomyces sp. NBC_00102]MCX5397251.1 DUF6232 family protein [Streptomyces sp. NBC_00102]
MRVGKQVLWVGTAAYPLKNITRVYSFLLTPQRGAATVLFLKRLGIILGVCLVLVLLNGLAGIGGGSQGGGLGGLIGVATTAGLIYCFVMWMGVMTAASHWVLAVETAGASTALVTSQNVEHLHQLVGYVVNAIENPEIEFQVRVETLSVNPKNYHFGDNVNMYGGSDNVGIAKS